MATTNSPQSPTTSSFSELNPFMNAARWRHIARRGFVGPAMLISFAVAVLFFYTDKVDTAVRVQRVCEAAPGVERNNLGYQYGINAAWIDCSVAVPQMQEERANAAERFNQVFGLLLLALAVYFVYSRGRRRVSMATLAGVFVITAFATWRWSADIDAPLFFLIKRPLVAIFGEADEKSGLLSSWLRMMLTTGIPEEFYKALPLLVAVWVTAKGKEPWRTRLRISEPLDGILFCAASAAGFIYAETYSMYVREQLIQQLAIQLAIPRVLGGIAGHIAYSTIAGYYIALGSLPGKKGIPIMALGVLLAASLHATWNTFGGGSDGALGVLVSTIIKIGAFGVMLVVIQAAREYSVLHGTAVETGVSGTYAIDTATLEVPVAKAPFAASGASLASPFATSTSSQAPDATIVNERVRTNSDFQGSPAHVKLTTSLAVLQLTSGATVSSDEWPGLIPQGDDHIVAQLLTHPDDHSRVGLRNHSSEAWKAFTAPGTQEVIVAPGAVLSLKNGMSIHTSAGDVTVTLA